VPRHSYSYASQTRSIIFTTPHVDLLHHYSINNNTFIYFQLNFSFKLYRSSHYFRKSLKKESINFFKEIIYSKIERFI